MNKEIRASLSPSVDVSSDTERTRNFGARMESKAGTEQGSQNERITIRICSSDKS